MAESYLARAWRNPIAIVRVAIGLYVAVHFAMLVPWAAELFSSAGMLPDASASPLARAFPNVLAIVDGPMFATAFVGLGALAGLCLALGHHHRSFAGVAAYVLACTFGRNPLIANPSLPYVGLLLVTWMLVGDEATRRGAWPRRIYGALWIAMAVGYTYSGVTKLAAPSWVDGTALQHVLANPLARPGGLGDVLRACPGWALQLATWATLGLEIVFAPLALSRRLRPWVWTAMVGMHVGLMLVVDFADLSAGMLLLHLATLDPRDFSRRPRPLRTSDGLGRASPQT